MSGPELFEGGYDLQEGIRIARQIEPYIDLLHVSVPVATIGGLNDPAQMEEIIASEKRTWFTWREPFWRTPFFHGKSWQTGKRIL